MNNTITFNSLEDNKDGTLTIKLVDKEAPTEGLGIKFTIKYEDYKNFTIEQIMNEFIKDNIGESDTNEIKTLTSSITLALETIVIIKEAVLKLNKRIEKIEKQLEPHAGIVAYANFASGLVHTNVVEGDINEIKCGECRNQYDSEYCVGCSIKNNFINFNKI
jgi:hypothetical protein